MTVLDTNLLGTVHGGVVMKLVDDVAGVVAQRHSGGPAVTASMDEMDFLEPVRVGDLVHAEAQVNWAGRTSMEVGVRVLAEPWNEAGVPPTRVATAYLVFVAVDDDGPAATGARRSSRRPPRTGAGSPRPRSGGRTGWPGGRRSCVPRETGGLTSPRPGQGAVAVAEDAAPVGLGAAAVRRLGGRRRHGRPRRRRRRPVGLARLGRRLAGRCRTWPAGRTRRAGAARRGHVGGGEGVGVSPADSACDDVDDLLLEARQRRLDLVERHVR